MKRAWIVAVAMGMMVSSGCLASHKYVKNEVKTSRDQLSTELTAKIDTTNGRIDTTDGNVKEVRDSVDLVNRRVGVVDERVSAVDSRVTGVDGRVTAVDGKVTAVDGKVAVVDGKVNMVDGRVANVDNKVAVVDERVSTLDTRTTEKLNTLKEDVGAVDEKAAQAMKDLNLLDEKFDRRNNLAVNAEHMIPFGFDSAKLDKANIAELDAIAATMMENHDAILLLEGRTDSTGDREYNLALGERRVEQVRRYLAVDKAIPVYRIHQISLGAARPIAANDSAEGRQKNRSVTITILAPSTDVKAAANDD